jgi:SSS family solute:Na+ symporter
MLCVIGMAIITNIDNRRGIVPKGLKVETSMFKPHQGFIVGTVLICGILAALYTMLW